MATLPLIRPTNPGIYQVCTTANTGYVLAVPDGASGLVIWFETSASNAALVGGRIGIDQTNTAVTSITGTDAVLGYHPAMPVEYDIETQSTGTSSEGAVTKGQDAYVHVACATALAVCKGMWLFASNAS